MRILFVSGELTGSALCQKLVAEGNEVKLHILRNNWKDCYTGLVSKTDDWKAELDWLGKGGLVVFDDVVFGREQDMLRKAGYTVVGGSEKADLLEVDRKYFQSILEQSGISPLESYKFDNHDDAIQFIRENPGEWVVKQTSHISAFNFVGNLKSGDDAIRVIERYRERDISPVHLQKRIHGIEVGVARYFNGLDWVGPIEINHEHKRLQDGDIGPLTPEMGTVLWYTQENVKLFTSTLDKLKPHLKEINFRGDFDINFIVNEHGAWPLEATPRFGCPSTEIQIELHISPWSEFLYAIGAGVPYDLEYKKGFGIAVSLVTHPFPYEPNGNFLDSILLSQRQLHFRKNFLLEHSEHVHFEEVSKIGDQFYWTGKNGLILHITAHGKSIEEARRLVYERVHGVISPVKYYRKDIGVRVMNHDIPQLKAWGWI